MPTRPSPPTPIVAQPPHIPLVRDPKDFPSVALPTVLLALVSYFGLFYSHFSTITTTSSSSLSSSLLVDETTGTLKMRSDFFLFPSYYLHFLLRTLCTYLTFTVMHDAAHDSIARPNSGCAWLNPLLGWISASCFGAPFSVFKTIHLDHHRYTNVELYDADLWSGGNFKGTAYSSSSSSFKRFFLLPARCMTLIYHYLVHAQKYLIQTWGWVELVRNIVVILALIVVPVLSSVVLTNFNYLFWGFHLPVLGAVLILGLFFDYLPHRPHHTYTDPIAATSLITLWNPTTVTSEEKLKSAKFTAEEIRHTGIDLLTIPLLSQNLHPIHHLYPNIPFYRYSSVYYRMADTLHKAGLKAHPLFPLIIEAKDE